MKYNFPMNNRAFTVIEVLITVLLFSFGLLGLAHFLKSGDDVQMHTKHILAATLEGQKVMSGVLLSNYEELVQGLEPQKASLWMQGKENRIQWAIFLEEKAPQLLEIKVRVNSEKLRESLYFTTFLAKK